MLLMNMCSERLFDCFWLDSHSAIAGIDWRSFRKLCLSSMTSMAEIKLEWIKTTSQQQQIAINNAWWYLPDMCGESMCCFKASFGSKHRPTAPCQPAMASRWELRCEISEDLEILHLDPFKFAQNDALLVRNSSIILRCRATSLGNIKLRLHTRFRNDFAMRMMRLCVACYFWCGTLDRAEGAMLFAKKSTWKISRNQ